MNSLGMIPVYYDAEFTGLHKNTTLISIGMIAENGRTFYAEFNDYDKSQVDDWLQENIINNLLFNDKEEYEEKTKVSTVMIKGNKEFVKKELLSWLKEIAGDTKVQFYTDCYVYDCVLLNDLICEDGQAINLPDYIYYIPYDLSTILQFKGIDPDIKRESIVPISFVQSLDRIFEESGKHNSLYDTIIAYKIFTSLNLIDVK